MDIQGSEDIYRYKNDTKIIFLLPPSYEEWMRRLEQRGAMSMEEKQRRLSSATKEITAALSLNNLELFINHDLLSSVAEINDYITKGNMTLDSNTQIRNHAMKLLEELKKHLN
jgi:guanylate kinase